MKIGIIAAVDLIHNQPIGGNPWFFAEHNSLF